MSDDIASSQITLSSSVAVGVAACLLLLIVPLLLAKVLPKRRRIAVGQSKCLVVTGAANGIGHALVLELLHRARDEIQQSGANNSDGNGKWTIVGIDLSEMDFGEAEQGNGESVEVLKFQASVTDPDAIQSVVDKLQARNVSCDVLCLCAGTTATGPLVELDLRRLKTVMDVNVYGTLCHFVFFFTCSYYVICLDVHCCCNWSWVATKILRHGRSIEVPNATTNNALLMLTITADSSKVSLSASSSSSRL